MTDWPTRRSNGETSPGKWQTVLGRTHEEDDHISDPERDHGIFYRVKDIPDEEGYELRRREQMEGNGKGKKRNDKKKKGGRDDVSGLSSLIVERVMIHSRADSLSKNGFRRISLPSSGSFFLVRLDSTMPSCHRSTSPPLPTAASLSRYAIPPHTLLHTLYPILDLPTSI